VVVVVVVVLVVCDVLKESINGNWMHDFMFTNSDYLILETVLNFSFLYKRSGNVVVLYVIP
jgi:hypothetical protein